MLGLYRLREAGRFRVLGGSWVAISGVTSPLIWLISIVTLLITPLIVTHEPPSKGHSDLSSSYQGGNFFISSSGNLKMGDFGIAKAGNVSELPQRDRQAYSDYEIAFFRIMGLGFRDCRRYPRWGCPGYVEPVFATYSSIRRNI